MIEALLVLLDVLESGVVLLIDAVFCTVWPDSQKIVPVMMI
jgi:hypothetical protein